MEIRFRARNQGKLLPFEVKQELTTDQRGSSRIKQDRIVFQAGRMLQRTVLPFAEEA
jgi:hypothetical protein